ncbi:MAG: C1 family peptidase [Pseudomonadota bacterium]
MNRMSIKSLLFVVVMFSVTLQANAQTRGMGLEFLPADQYRSIPLAPPLADIALPHTVDMSDKFPPVGDQGAQGSCVGWAVGYALKSYHEALESNWTSWNEQRLMSPSYIYDQIRLGDGCDRGSYISEAMELLTREGLVALDQAPYIENSCSFSPGAFIKQSAAANRIANWFRVNVQDTETLKRHLAAGIPIVIGAKIDDNFSYLQKGQIWQGRKSDDFGGHAMVVVGYDDSVSAFKIINSWGADWASDGYGYISYDAFKREVFEAYVTQDFILPPDAERRDRETPYVSNIPHGPSIGPFQLGMTIGQFERVMPATFKQVGDSYTGKLKFDDHEAAVEFNFDRRNDYLDSIEVDLLFSNETEAFGFVAPQFVRGGKLSVRGIETDLTKSNVVFKALSDNPFPEIAALSQFLDGLTIEFAYDNEVRGLGGIGKKSRCPSSDRNRTCSIGTLSLHNSAKKLAEFSEIPKDRSVSRLKDTVYLSNAVTAFSLAAWRSAFDNFNVRYNSLFEAMGLSDELDKIETYYTNGDNRVFIADGYFHNDIATLLDLGGCHEPDEFDYVVDRFVVLKCVDNILRNESYELIHDFGVYSSFSLGGFYMDFNYYADSMTDTDLRLEGDTYKTYSPYFGLRAGFANGVITLKARRTQTPELIFE